MKKGIIFDLDGTLWDSTEQILISWNSVLEQYPQYGGPISMEQLQGLMGKTMDVIAESIMPNAPEEERKQIFAQCCKEEEEYLLKHGGVLFPRLEETLKKLKEDYSLYIVSNCQSGYIETFIEHHKLNSYFADIECFGNTGLGKAENEKILAERNQLDQVVYVGDTQGDFDATQKAGFPFVYAAYGFGKVEEEVPFVSSFEQLPEVVKQVFTKN